MGRTTKPKRDGVQKHAVPSAIWDQFLLLGRKRPSEKKFGNGYASNNNNRRRTLNRKTVIEIDGKPVALAVGSEVVFYRDPTNAGIGTVAFCTIFDNVHGYQITFQMNKLYRVRNVRAR